MADADQQHDAQQDEAPVLDLEVPEDEASSVAGGNELVSNIMKTKHDAAKNALNNVR